MVSRIILEIRCVKTCLNCRSTIYTVKSASTLLKFLFSYVKSTHNEMNYN